MDFLHCARCKRAYDSRKNAACPNCSLDRRVRSIVSASTRISELASELAEALAQATSAELAALWMDAKDDSQRKGHAFLMGVLGYMSRGQDVVDADFQTAEPRIRDVVLARGRRYLQGAATMMKQSVPTSMTRFSSRTFRQ